MAIELWTPNDLFMLRNDPRMDPLPSWILDTYFTQEHYSEDDEIRFADLPESDRFLAPFVLPYEQGKPLDIRHGETVSAFTPPYIKLKNAVRPEDARNLKPSEIFRNGGRRPSLAERFDMRVTEIVERHLRAIRVREIWMAARAFIDAKVQIDYERDQGAANPSVLLDFGRDAGHTVTLVDDFWSDPATDIIGNVETWANTMVRALRGGAPSILLVGAQVAPYFRNNTGIKDMLDTRYRGGESVTFDRGVQIREQPLTRIGQLSNNIEVWMYKDTVDIPNGSGGKTKIDLFNEKDIMLIAPGATGVRAYGAIYDTKAIEAGLQNSNIFQKMFETDDPGERFVLSQSSPLPIPLYPNRTFKARVLA
ncbi:major capsid protein E [Rhizobium phage RHph_X2_30]|nr:major capsid protein E [Rhizobium phage RHph_X2_30]